MTIKEILESDKDFLLTTDVEDILHLDACRIRSQAHDDPTKLGFNCIVCGSRVLIPRKQFLKFIGEEA